MEAKNIVDGAIGPEASYDVDFVDGKIQIALKYDGKQADAALTVSVELIQALKIAASKTDNKIDDSMVSLIEGALS